MDSSCLCVPSSSCHNSYIHGSTNHSCHHQSQRKQAQGMFHKTFPNFPALSPTSFPSPSLSHSLPPSHSLTERMWLPFGPDNRGTSDWFMFPFGATVVRCCNSSVNDPRQFPSDGIRVCCSRREAAILRSSRTASYPCTNFLSDRCFRLLDSISQAHPDAHSLRCLPLHGNIVIERITGMCYKKLDFQTKTNFSCRCSLVY